MKCRIHNFKWVLFLLSVFLVMMFIMRKTAAEVGRLSEGQGILDLTFAVSPECIKSALGRYSPIGAAFYRFVFLWVDFIYAMTYCTFYRSAIGYFCDESGVDEHTDIVLTSLPLIGIFADILENNVMFIILSPNTENYGLYATFTVFNIIKFLFVYASLAVTLGGFLCLLKKRLS